MPECFFCCCKMFHKYQTLGKTILVGSSNISLMFTLQSCLYRYIHYINIHIYIFGHDTSIHITFSVKKLSQHKSLA